MNKDTTPKERKAVLRLIDKFEKRHKKGTASEMWGGFGVYEILYLRDLIEALLAQVRDNAYKDGARTQAKMDADLITQVREETIGEMEKIIETAKLNTIKDFPYDKDLINDTAGSIQNELSRLKSLEKEDK